MTLSMPRIESPDTEEETAEKNEKDDDADDDEDAQALGLDATQWTLGGEM